MKKTFNMGRKATDVKSGDQIFLRNDAKTDSLDLSRRKWSAAVTGPAGPSTAAVDGPPY